MKSSTNCNCEKLKRALVTKTIRIGSKSVKVENAPAQICEDCGEIHFDGRYILDLEKKLKSREKQAA